MLHQQIEPVSIQAHLMLELLLGLAGLIERRLGALERGAIPLQFLGSRGILRGQLCQRFLLPL